MTLTNKRAAELRPIAIKREAGQDSAALGARKRRCRVGLVHHELVEERRAEARAYPGGRERRGRAMGQFDVARSQLAQPPPPHHREIHRGRERTQRMVGADVGGRALAPDMLLARGQRQAPRAPSEAIVRLAHQPPGHLAQMRRPRRHEAHSGSAELRREAEALALADRDVGAELAGRFQKAERERLRP